MNLKTKQHSGRELLVKSEHRRFNEWREIKAEGKVVLNTLNSLSLDFPFLHATEMLPLP